MAEIPDVISGELILASYANQIRDRAVMRYQDAPARDLSVPLPNAGDLAYLSDVAYATIYTGSVWHSLLLGTDSDQPIDRNMILGDTFPASPYKFESRRTVAGFQVGARWDVTSISAAAGDQGFSFAVDRDAVPVEVFQMLQNRVRSLTTFEVNTANIEITSADSTSGLRIIRAGRTFRLDPANAGFQFVNFRTEQSDLYFRFSPGTAQRLLIRSDGIEVSGAPLILADSSELVLNQATGLTGTNYGLPLAHPGGTIYGQIIQNQTDMWLDPIDDVFLAAPTTTGGPDVRYNNVGGVNLGGRLSTHGTGYPLRLASSSTERVKKIYKTKMAATDPNHPKRLTEAEMKTWRYQDGYLAEGDPREGEKYLGPTAESLAAVFPFAVDFDADGEPLNLNQDVIRAALIWLASDHERRLAALESV
jgi:hypothetical protein